MNARVCVPVGVRVVVSVCGLNSMNGHNEMLVSIHFINVYLGYRLEIQIISSSFIQ